MKILSLIFIRIKRYFQINKMIFILFLLGSVTSCITFIYFYGNTVTAVANRTDSFYLFREFCIAPDVSEVLNQEQKQVLQKYPLEDWKVQSIVSGNEVQSEKMGKVFKEDLAINNVISISSIFRDDTGLLASTGRVEFTKEELENKKRVVVLPSDFGNSLDFPENISLMGHDFQVIGVQQGYSKEFFIPSSTYDDLKLETGLITIDLKNRLSHTEEEAFEREMREVFPGCLIQSPSDTIQDFEQGTLGEILLVSVVYFLSTLSFLFLIKFLMDAHSPEDITYFLVGAKKSTVIIITMLQNLILILCSGIIGIVLHRILWNPIFTMINYSSNVQYNFVDYLVILSMMLIISAIAQIPFLWNYYRKSLILLKQKYIMGD